MPPRSALLALAAAGALVAGGCGGSDAEAVYAKDVNGARAELQHRLAAVPEIGTPTSTRAQDVRTLSAYQAAARQARLRLLRADAPEDLGVLHARLLAAVRSYEHRLDQGRKRLAAASGGVVLAIRAQLAEGLAAAAKDINAAIAELNRRLGD
jgi:hypothetical protein